MPAQLPELDSILHSGALAYGKWGREFEKRLSNYLGVKHVLLTNSYGTAWQVLLAALNLNSGDEVIASPMACLQSNMPFALAGLNVVWADINPHYGVIDPDSARSKITTKTRLIAHNHFCGYPGYIDEINAIGREKGIMVVDDCIEAFGSQYKGRRLGNVGTPVSIFSFQTVRLPNTIEGGALVIEDDELYQKAVIACDLGIDRPRFRDERGEISPLCDISTVGVAATPSDVNSYIGCCQIEEVDKLLSKQSYNAKRWGDKLSDMLSLFGFISRKDTEPNYWIFGLLSNCRDADMKMFRESGYACSSVHLPNNYYSVFGEHIELPGVMEFYNHFIALPCGWWM
jgi:dTDP-4-amino-4,6-dideoxygalactose transaminase